MEKFLDQFVHYLCSRCLTNVPHHTEQEKTGGKHSHNGEILDHLLALEPTSDRILYTYRLWQSHQPPRNIQRQMARAYNRATRVKPVTPEESAVKLIIDNIDDVWIRHGPEQPNSFSPSVPFPTPDSRIPVGEAVLVQPGENWYAIDLDSTPFQAFEEHTVELTSGYPWTYTVGLVPYSTFQAHGGELRHPTDRDHYYARSEIPATEWVFLYRDYDGYVLDREQQEHIRNQILNSGVPAIDYNTYRRLIQCHRHLKQYARTSPSRLR